MESLPVGADRDEGGWLPPQSHPAGGWRLAGREVSNGRPVLPCRYPVSLSSDLEWRPDRCQDASEGQRDPRAGSSQISRLDLRSWAELQAHCSHS